MFEAMTSWDEDVLKLILRGSDLNAISKIYRGCTLIECGKSFRSGVYTGVYVLKRKGGKPCDRYEKRQSLENLDKRRRTLKCATY